MSMVLEINQNLYGSIILDKFHLTLVLNKRILCLIKVNPWTSKLHEIDFNDGKHKINVTNVFII